MFLYAIQWQMKHVINRFNWTQYFRHSGKNVKIGTFKLKIINPPVLSNIKYITVIAKWLSRSPRWDVSGFKAFGETCSVTTKSRRWGQKKNGSNFVQLTKVSETWCFRFLPVYSQSNHSTWNSFQKDNYKDNNKLNR